MYTSLCTQYHMIYFLEMAPCYFQQHPVCLYATKRISSPKNENVVVIISSPYADEKSQSFVVHRTFLDLHSKTALQNCPEQLKKLGTLEESTSPEYPKIFN